MINMRHTDPPPGPSTPTPITGALDGGPQCHMSILINAHVTCHYLFNCDIDFKITRCRMSILINSPWVVYFNSYVIIGSMSHVDFKKCSCHRVEFRGQGPYYRLSSAHRPQIKGDSTRRGGKSTLPPSLPAHHAGRATSSCGLIRPCP